MIGISTLLVSRLLLCVYSYCCVSTNLLPALLQALLVEFEQLVLPLDQLVLHGDFLLQVLQLLVLLILLNL